jgi:hypothetical protein
MTGNTNQDIELNDDENVVEAHDPKNAEDESIKSVKDAIAVGKIAPARKNDKKNSEKTDLKTATKVESVDFSDDLDALVNEEATLSEGFRNKAGVIFEAALKSKLSEEVNRMEENYAEALQEEIATAKTEMVEKVDSYLNYVVENWMEENRLAIHNGLRTEIAEGFMDKLKDLFEESYIAVPDSKVDLVDDLAEQVEALEEKLNNTTKAAIEMTEELNLYRRFEVIREAARGLAESQVEKLAALAEDLEFDDEESFALKVKTIKESYFSKKSTVNSNVDTFEEEQLDEAVEISGAMAAYVNAIKKNNK